jgi:hypothetical protein
VLGGMREGKIERLKEGQVITCRKETTNEEIALFFERCIRDIDNEYAMLGYDNLSQEQENMVITMIEETMQKSNNRMKLSFAGRQTANRLYRFFCKKMNVVMDKNDVAPNPKFKEMLSERFMGQKNKYGHLRLYTSSYPGLGKTYEIINEIKAANRVAVFFPMSGRVNSESLFKRLSSKAS